MSSPPRRSKQTIHIAAGLRQESQNTEHKRRGCGRLSRLFRQPGKHTVTPRHPHQEDSVTVQMFCVSKRLLSV